MKLFKKFSVDLERQNGPEYADSFLLGRELRFLSLLYGDLTIIRTKDFEKIAKVWNIQNTRKPMTPGMAEIELEKIKGHLA